MEQDLTSDVLVPSLPFKAPHYKGRYFPLVIGELYLRFDDGS